VTPDGYSVQSVVSPVPRLHWEVGMTGRSVCRDRDRHPWVREFRDRYSRTVSGSRRR
jgi:hypothetical protein